MSYFFRAFACVYHLEVFILCSDQPILLQSARDPACSTAVSAAGSRKSAQCAVNFIGIKPDPWYLKIDHQNQSKVTRRVGSIMNYTTTHNTPDLIQLDHYRFYIVVDFCQIHCSSYFTTLIAWLDSRCSNNNISPELNQWPRFDCDYLRLVLIKQESFLSWGRDYVTGHGVRPWLRPRLNHRLEMRTETCHVSMTWQN